MAYWPSRYFYNVQANSNLILEEGSTTNNEIFIDSDIEIKMADFPSSYSESIKKSDFHLYPNPANNQIIIESSIEALSISIYNANGQEVQTYHSSNPFHNFTFKTASLSPGLYFIKLVGKDHTFQVQKMTIVR